MSSLKIGDTVERYVVEAILGTGGVATVYLVRHRQLDSLYALKFLHLDHPKLRDRMLQEGKLQATLRHPNIVSVHDVLDIDGAPALLMEYISGGSLEEMIDYEEISIGRAETIFKEVVEGVKYAHDRGMIHRDLKPGNILITDEGLPKISDFGIARVLSERTQRATMQGIALGTPQYMAPEQMRDAASVDHRADIFSLGVILYELLCNETPYKGTDPMSTMAAITSGMYKPIEEIREGVPKYLRRVVESCLEPSRHQRPASCELLLAMLDQGVQHLTAQGTLQTEEVDEDTWLFPSQPTPTPDTQPPEDDSTLFDEGPSESPTQPDPPAKAPVVPPTARPTNRPVWLYLLLLAPAFMTFLALTDRWEGSIQYTLLNAIHQPSAESENVVLLSMKPDSDINAMRQFHAQMLHLLADQKPSVIVFDINFARSTPYDSELAEAIGYSKAQGVPVILPTRISNDKANWFSHPALGENAEVGIAETGEDQANGWIRRIKIFKDTLNKDRLWHITALAANAHMKSRTPPRIENDDTLVVGNLRVPVVHNLLYIGAMPPPRHLTYSPDSNLSAVSDKIVIIGSASSIDVHNTPFGGRYGPEVVGMYIETLLQQSAPRPLSVEINALLALFTGLIIAWLRQQLPPARQWFAWLGLVGALIIAGLLTLNHFLVAFIPIVIAAGIGWWLEKPSPS